MNGRRTNPAKTPAEATVLGLRALGWTLAEPERAARLLALTGLDPEDLRARADAPPVLAALLGFLEAHEPDLVACADALDVAPSALVEARGRLET
jgi:2-hydroxychromene-2-carboxylate isomerase